jgi:hypothetical protein
MVCYLLDFSRYPLFGNVDLIWELGTMKKILILCSMTFIIIIPYDLIGGPLYPEIYALSTIPMSNPLIIILIGSGLLVLATIRMWWK